MSDTQFQEQVLQALSRIESDVSTLKSDVSTLKSDLHEFKENQEQFNSAIWGLNQQAFSHINDIRSEIVAPWKIRATQNI